MNIRQFYTSLSVLTFEEITRLIELDTEERTHSKSIARKQELTNRIHAIKQYLSFTYNNI